MNGMQVYNQVSSGQFQFLKWSDFWCPARCIFFFSGLLFPWWGSGGDLQMPVMDCGPKVLKLEAEPATKALKKSHGWAA